MVPIVVMLGCAGVIMVPVRLAAVTMPLKLALVPVNVDATRPEVVPIPLPKLRVAADTFPDRDADVPTNDVATNPDAVTIPPDAFKADAVNEPESVMLVPV